MKHKNLILIGLILSSAVYAISAEDKAVQEQENLKMLAQMGMPLPGAGIKVIPREQLNLSQEQLAKGAKEDEDVKTKGYVNKYTNRPKELLGFEDFAKAHMATLKNLSPTSTELRSNVHEIKLAFTPKQLNKAYASVPQGGYHEDKGGWSGVVQFFNDKNVGSCSYGVMNVKASNTSAELAQEDVTYSINNKPTLSHVEGSESSGFLYTVEWFDDENFHALECGNMKFSAKIHQDLIQLAKNIDNQ